MIDRLYWMGSSAGIHMTGITTIVPLGSNDWRANGDLPHLSATTAGGRLRRNASFATDLPQLIALRPDAE
ncbi:MAG: hypothetical protein WAO83_10165 [Fuerstiella sp.]